MNRYKCAEVTQQVVAGLNTPGGFVVGVVLALGVAAAMLVVAAIATPLLVDRWFNTSAWIDQRIQLPDLTGSTSGGRQEVQTPETASLTRGPRSEAIGTVTSSPLSAGIAVVPSAALSASLSTVPAPASIAVVPSRDPPK